MEYMSVLQAAEKWGISDRRVRLLCQQQKIPNVVKQGRAYLIPADAEKPDDGRRTRYKRNNRPYITLQAIFIEHLFITRPLFYMSLTILLVRLSQVE